MRAIPCYKWQYLDQKTMAEKSLKNQFIQPKAKLDLYFSSTFSHHCLAAQKAQKEHRYPWEIV